MTGFAAKPYGFTFAPRAVRDLEKLPEVVAAACVEFVAGPLATDPYGWAKPLMAPWKGYWSARRGSYRVIYRIDESAGRVRVVHVDHRSRVYGRR